MEEAGPARPSCSVYNCGPSRTGLCSHLLPRTPPLPGPLQGSANVNRVCEPPTAALYEDRSLGATAMLCAAARAPVAAPARCPRTTATPGREARAIITGRRCTTTRPGVSSFDRELGGSSSAPSADFGPDARLQQTISDIDALLGIDVEAARAEAAAAAAAAAPASGSAAAEPAVPAEWAHLPAEELVRRQKLVSAGCMP